jgi:hypothetical protein
VSVIYTRGGNPDLTLQQQGPREVTLFSMAQTLLDLVTDLARDRNLDLPSRQIIYPAPIPADCPQVAVLFDSWQPMPPWESFETCRTFRWCGSFQLVISRATPAMPGRSGQAPSPDAMGLAAQIASADAELLIAVVDNLGEIGPELSIVTPAPEGGIQSTVLSVLLPAFGGLT